MIKIFDPDTTFGPRFSIATNFVAIEKRGPKSLSDPRQRFWGSFLDRDKVCRDRELRSRNRCRGFWGPDKGSNTRFCDFTPMSRPKVFAKMRICDSTRRSGPKTNVFAILRPRPDQKLAILRLYNDNILSAHGRGIRTLGRDLDAHGLP